MWIIFESKVAGAIYCYCICRNGYLVLKGSILWFIQLQKEQGYLYNACFWRSKYCRLVWDPCWQTLLTHALKAKEAQICVYQEDKKLPLISLVLIMAHATLASYIGKLLRFRAQKSKVLYLANLCHMLKFVSRNFLKILLKSSGYL